MFTRLKNLFKIKPQYMSSCYCPGCKHELCGNKGYKNSSSYVEHFSDNSVHYKCIKCGTETRWDSHAHAPAPLLLETKDQWGEWRSIPSEEWKCRYTECDHGTGLAGRDSCPGDPRIADCEHFTTIYSDYDPETCCSDCGRLFVECVCVTGGAE